MKKNYIILFLLIFIIVSCKDKKPEIVIIPDYEKNHLQKNHLFGNIKEIHTTFYYQYDSTSTLKITSYITQYYSPDRVLLKIVTDDENGSLVSTQYAFYHDNSKEDYWIISDAYGKTTDSCKYQYDMNRFIAEEKRWHADSLLLTTTYKTDGVGNIMELKQNNNAFTLIKTITYSSNGLVSKIEEFEPSGKLFKYITIEYDQNGNEVNKRVFKSNNSLLEYTYNQYNEKGYLLKVIYENNMHRFRETYIYSDHDAHGNWLTEKRGNYIKERKIIYY